MGAALTLFDGKFEGLDTGAVVTGFLPGSAESLY